MITALSIGQVTHDRYDGEIVPGGCAFYGSKAWSALGGGSRLIVEVDSWKCEKVEMGH